MMKICMLRDGADARPGESDMCEVMGGNLRGQEITTAIVLKSARLGHVVVSGVDMNLASVQCDNQTTPGIRIPWVRDNEQCR